MMVENTISIRMKLVRSLEIVTFGSDEPTFFSPFPAQHQLSLLWTEQEVVAKMCAYSIFVKSQINVYALPS